MVRLFNANFDSGCGKCCCEIYAGDPVGWRDGEVVHEDCMDDEEEPSPSLTATAAPAATPAATIPTAYATREREKRMTDAMPETVGPDTEAEGWGDAEASYPEYPDNPHNHVYTVSMDGRGPMIVVRGNTPQEVSERYQALMDGGVTTIAASVYSHMKAEMAVAQGLGPVSPVGPPQGAPAPVQAVQPMPLPQTPQAQYPVGPPVPSQPYPGQPQWQQAGAPQQQVTDEYRQAGWQKLTVPFRATNGNPGKPGFDQIMAQYGLRKGRPSEGGQVSFQKADKSWYCSPECTQVFSMFQPVPA